jgi:hypothetical protein
MWFATGPESTFRPFLIDSLTGAIPVYVYTLISVLVMLAFLGGTSHVAVSELSVKNQVEAIQEKTNTLETNQETQQRTLSIIQNDLYEVNKSIESTASNLSEELDSQKKEIMKNAEENEKAIAQTNKNLSKQISNQGEAIMQSFEEGNQNQQKLIEGIQGRLFLFDDTLNDFKKQLGNQTELMKANDAQLAENVDSQLNNFKETLAKLESKNSKTATTIMKQRDEIDEIRNKLEQLEVALVAPKSMLNGNSKVEDVKGIGPIKTAELNDIGVQSVSDFIMADPKVIAEKLGFSEKTVEKLQGRAQLQMIPGIKEKDLLLLEELDITDRKSLAMQDPIELGKKVNAIFKVNLASGNVLETDKPTIEEVVSWVKHTKS